MEPAQQEEDPPAAQDAAVQVLEEEVAPVAQDPPAAQAAPPPPAAQNAPIQDPPRNETVAQRIRRNDPTLTEIGRPIITRSTDWRDIGAALVEGHNTHVKELVFSASPFFSIADLADLMQWIRDSRSLEKAALIVQHGMAPLYLIPLLSMFTVMANRENFYLMAMGLPYMALECILSCDARMRYLYIKDCDIPNDRIAAASDLFQRTRAAKIVSLGGFETWWAPILNGIRQNDMIQRLHLREASIAQELWPAISAMGYISIIYLKIDSEDMRSLIDGIAANPAITVLAFRACKLPEDSLSVLEELPTRCPNIKEIEFGETKVPARTLQTLISPQSSVTKLVVLGDAAEEVDAIMESLRLPSSPVTHLELKGYNARIGQRVIESLRANLPKFVGLESIDFFIPEGVAVDANELLQAFERNGSLLRIRIQDGDRGVFNPSDKAKFKHYVVRNRRLKIVFNKFPVGEDSPPGVWKARALLYHHGSNSIVGRDQIYKDLLNMPSTMGLWDAISESSTVATPKKPRAILKSIGGRTYFDGEPGDQHIRFGRGDCNTKHSGNKRFFEFIIQWQPDYKKALNVEAKRAIIHGILESLEESNMFFVDFDKACDKWYKVPLDEKRIYKKIAQSLRDDHSQLGRKVKRVKHRQRVQARKTRPGFPSEASASAVDHDGAGSSDSSGSSVYTSRPPKRRRGAESEASGDRETAAVALALLTIGRSAP